MTAEESSRLVERLHGGDPVVLACFIELHRPSLMAYIDRRLGDLLRSKVEADDLIQETAAAALRALPNADFGRCDPFGWLCHLADERIIDAYRRHVQAQKRSAVREIRMPRSPSDTTRPTFQQLLEASLTSPSQACMRSEQERALAQAVASLPEEQREAIRLRFVEGLPSKEIAQRLGKADVAVRVMVSRAVQKLRSLLEAS